MVFDNVKINHVLHLFLNTLDCHREIHIPRKTRIMITKFMGHVENMNIQYKYPCTRDTNTQAQ